MFGDNPAGHRSYWPIPSPNDARRGRRGHISTCAAGTHQAGRARVGAPLSVAPARRWPVPRHRRKVVEEICGGCPPRDNEERLNGTRVPTKTGVPPMPGWLWTAGSSRVMLDLRSLSLEVHPIPLACLIRPIPNDGLGAARTGPPMTGPTRRRATGFRHGRAEITPSLPSVDGHARGARLGSGAVWRRPFRPSDWRAVLSCVWSVRERRRACQCGLRPRDRLAGPSGEKRPLPACSSRYAGRRARAAAQAIYGPAATIRDTPRGWASRRGCPAVIDGHRAAIIISILAAVTKLSSARSLGAISASVLGLLMLTTAVSAQSASV